MQLVISLSAKQVGILYHLTNKQALLTILKTGKLALSTGRAMTAEHQYQASKSFFASFTRSRFGGYHYREGGKTSVHDDTNVMITLDGNALSAREKIVPVDYWGVRGDLTPGTDRNKEVEERLVSNRSEISILKYIKRIDFVQRGVVGEVKTYGFDKGKFKIDDNDRQQRLLGSLILRLKTNKIPFAFYDSMDDWAKKRGEYSYTGKTDVEKADTYISRPSKYSIESLKALLETLSNLPYEKLSEKAQKVSYQLYTYPNDVSAVFNDYENYRKPDAPFLLRSLTLKVVRQMKRLGFNSKQEAGKYISDKYRIYVEEEQRKQRLVRNTEAAKLIVAALTLPIAKWPSSKNVWISPKSVFGQITDRFSYLSDEAERMVKDVLETPSPETSKLKSVMKDLDLNNAYDVVSHIYYEKVKPTL
jgi:hypothetical protein